MLGYIHMISYIVLKLNVEIKGGPINDMSLHSWNPRVHVLYMQYIFPSYSGTSDVFWTRHCAHPG